MSDHPHPLINLARRAWDAVARSDIDAMREFFDPDVTWHATGSTPWAGTHRGFDGVIDYLAKVGDSTDEFDADLIDVLVSKERAMLLFTATLGLGGTRVETEYSLLAHIRDGLIREVWTAPLDPASLSRFWN